MRRASLILAVALASGAAVYQVQAEHTCGNPPHNHDKCSGAGEGHSFDSATGMETREVTDLAVDGAVGEIPMRFSRLSTSRWTGSPYWSFGAGGNWRHSFYYSVSYAGANAYGPKFYIDYASGSTYYFAKFGGGDHYFGASDDGSSPLSDVHERVENVATNEFALWFLDGTRMAFYTNLVSGATVCAVRGLFDRHNLFYQFTLDSSNRVTRVTEPAGRYLDIRYAWPTNFNGTANQEVITNITASTGLRVDYVYGTITNGACGSSCIFTTLKEVHYGDGTHASYTYVAAKADGYGQPMLATADDPRFEGTDSRVQYVYNADLSAYDVQGFIYQVKSLVSGGVIAQLNVSTNETGQRTIVQGNGGTISINLDGSNQYASQRVDTLGRTTQYLRYSNGAGMLYGTVDPLGRTNIFNLTWEFAAISGITNADGTARMYTFTDVTKPFFHASETNEAGQVTVYTYGAVAPATNLVTRIDYPDTSYETLTYNSFGQITSQRLRSGAIVTNLYDSTGLLVTNRNAAGFATIYAYDSTNRLASVTDARGNTTSFKYNSRGQITRITHPDSTYVSHAFDTYGNRTNTVNELGHTTSFTYDEYNRLVMATDPLSRVTTYDYSIAGAGGCGCGSDRNLPTKITDPKGNVVVNVYDTEWQLIAQTNAEKQATLWTYDAVGNRKTQTDANGHTYTWVYDKRNRVASETNALSQATTFKYDVLGNRTNRVDGAGIQTFWTYDTMNRVTSTGSGTLTYEYGYDAGGRRTNMNTKVSGSVTERTTYAYDARDLMLSKADPTGFTLNYGYDAVGNRTNLSIASVLSQSYTYDSRNRVTTMVGNSATTTFSYDAAGRRTSAVWPNSSTGTNAYDNANQLLSLVHKTSGGFTIASFAYGYDLAGNRTNMTTLEGVNSYSYNSNNWLTAVTYPGGRTQTFKYDSIGNRTNLVDSGTGASPVAYSYDAGNRLLSSTAPGETNSYLYDGAGRLTNQTVNLQPRTFQYSFRSQMTSLTDTNSTAFSYDFDGDGNRTKQARAGCLTERFVYDGPNVVLDLNASNQVTHAYVNGLGIDQPIERIDFIP